MMSISELRRHAARTWLFASLTIGAAGGTIEVAREFSATRPDDGSWVGTWLKSVQPTDARRWRAFGAEAPLAELLARDPTRGCFIRRTSRTIEARRSEHEMAVASALACVVDPARCDLVTEKDSIPSDTTRFVVDFDRVDPWIAPERFERIATTPQFVLWRPRGAVR